MELRLGVTAEADEDAGDAAPWLAGLREELAELDDMVVEDVDDAVPDSAKGIGALASLLARIPSSGITMFIEVVQAWAARTGRTVEASLGGDTIKITGASREQQDRVIEAWLADHATWT